MGFWENKYIVSSTAPATEVLRNWKGCCLRWCCCFAAKKQALPCLNILFSRNLKTLYKWLPWLHLLSVPSANWQASQRLTETTTRAQANAWCTVQRTEGSQAQASERRQTSWRNRQSGKWNNQRRGSVRVGVGLLTEQRIPSFQTTPSIRGSGSYESKIGQPETEC